MKARLLLALLLLAWPLTAQAAVPDCQMVGDFDTSLLAAQDWLGSGPVTVPGGPPLPLSLGSNTAIVVVIGATLPGTSPPLEGYSVEDDAGLSTVIGGPGVASAPSNQYWNLLDTNGDGGTNGRRVTIFGAFGITGFVGFIRLTHVVQQPILAIVLNCTNIREPNWADRGAQAEGNSTTAATGNIPVTRGTVNQLILSAVMSASGATPTSTNPLDHIVDTITLGSNMLTVFQRVEPAGTNLGFTGTVPSGLWAAGTTSLLALP